MKKFLNFQVNLTPKARTKLTQEQLKKISGAIYAAIEGECEEIRKGRMEEYGITAEVDTYTISVAQEEV